MNIVYVIESQRFLTEIDINNYTDSAILSDDTRREPSQNISQN